MPPRPVRPTPSEKVLDYDDGDPYSCMAAGRQEDLLQKALQDRVELCFGRPAEQLRRLAEEDPASVKTALFDLWAQARETRTRPDLARWAAEQMAHLGDSSLVDFDRANPA